MTAPFLNLIGSLVLMFVCSCHGNRLNDRRTVEDFTDMCMLGQNHKEKPGPEGDLFQECTPWKNRACCTADTTTGLHQNISWYKFSWHHCRQLSSQCEQHFRRDLCFYECSPNTGPWLVQESRTWRRERFAFAPLCQSDCIRWWSDCRTDMTCLENWSGGQFNFSTGVNKCPNNAPCRTFEEVFKNATNFCQKIWDDSWKVVPNSQPCLKIWFDGPNPNDAVARQKAMEILKVNSAEKIQFSMGLFMVFMWFSFEFVLGI